MRKRIAANIAFGLIGIAALLAGCATPARRQAQVIRSGVQVAAQNYRACTLALYISPEAAPLRRNLPFNVEDTSLEKQLNTRYISDGEAKAVLAIYPKLQSCRRSLINEISATAPTASPILLTGWERGDENLLRLIKRQENWDQFVLAGKENVAQTRALLVAEDRRITAGLVAENEAELARRRAAAVLLGAGFAAAVGGAPALSGYAGGITGHPSPPPPPPSTGFSCTSRRIIPGMVNTTCN